MILKNEKKDLTEREKFLNKLHPYLLRRELENVAAAYVFAKYGHREQERDNGERYFDHPRAVALILIDELEIRDWRMIVTALIHDLIEDTFIFSEERVRINFGKMVTLWLKLLSKKPKEGYLKRLLEADDWRLWLIKLCDRLHNSRTLKSCTTEKQKRKIKETIDFYLPLCDLLIARAPKKWRKNAEHIRKELSAICEDYSKRLEL